MATNCEEFGEIKIAKSAKYVGTTSGPEGHSWTAHRKIILRTQKIIASTKSLVERLCDANIYALSVLCYTGSISAPDEATLKADAHALPCTTAGPYSAILTIFLCVGSIWSLGPDLLGIRSVSLAARYRTAASSDTLTRGLEKIQAARGYDLVPIFALSSDWEEKFLIHSMAHSTAEAFNIVRCLDQSGKLDDSPQDKKQDCHSLAP